MASHTSSGFGWASSGRKLRSGEPEPIDAEFEANADVATEADAKANPKPEKRPPARRSRSVTLTELMLASVAAAALGAVTAIVVASANSSSPAGTLAQEIDTLSQDQTGLTARTDQAGADIVMLRSRLDAHDEALAQRLAGEKTLTTELAALTSQISALIGVGDGQPVPGATANTSPLGALLGRMNRLEAIVRDDADAPATTAQMQRTLKQLSDQVASLDQTSQQLAAAINRRQTALSALENGLVKANGDIDALRAAQGGPINAAAGAPESDLVAAAATSRTIRALSALQAAAQSGQPFVNRQRTLAALLPGDRDVLALGEIARRGAPTLDALRRSFPVAARRADSLAAARSDDGWNWLRASVSGIVPLSRPGLDEAAATAIQSARRAIDVGDARGAIDALDGLAPDTLVAFHAWRLQALRRAELDERLDLLNARLASPIPVPAAAATEG
jgi:hypothetical protein